MSAIFRYFGELAVRWPDCRNLLSGLPRAVFDSEVIGSASFENLDERWLQYSPTRGSICAIVARWSAEKFGLDGHQDRTMIVSGAQEGLFLIMQSILSCYGKNACFVFEEPCYIGLSQIAEVLGVIPEYVPVKRSGLCVQTLEQRLREEMERGRKCFLFITPDFQNPTGVQCSACVRKKVVDLCVKFGALLVEDSP